MSTTAVRPALANPLAAFEEYLARTRGVCPGTRHNYITYAGAFLEAVSAGAAGAAGEIGPREVAEFVRDLTGRYETGTVCPAASALRSFFRFLQIEGVCGGDLAEAVPMVPRRRTAWCGICSPSSSSSRSRRWPRPHPATCVTGPSSCASRGWDCAPARSRGCGWKTSTGRAP